MSESLNLVPLLQAARWFAIRRIERVVMPGWLSVLETKRLTLALKHKWRPMKVPKTMGSAIKPALNHADQFTSWMVGYSSPIRLWKN